MLTKEERWALENGVEEHRVDIMAEWREQWESEHVQLVVKWALAKAAKELAETEQASATYEG